jgi:enamine deaminase RidA (YjgF/YER057c/UK114 family)
VVLPPARDTRCLDRRLVSSGSPYEPTIGFSRAVRDGRHVFVAGTCAVMPESVTPPADAYGQAKRCLEIIAAALAEVGAAAEHVVRTRTFLLDATDWEEVGRAHGELFRHVRPASTMIVVSALLDPRWLVEIDHALLGGDERRESRDELRQGSPTQYLVSGSVCRHDFAATQNTRSCKRCRPVVDLPQCFFHGARY